MLELTSYDLMQKLHERYHALIRQTAPEGMRPPTINEVRRFDREFMKQALKFKAEGQGDLSHCLEYDLDSPSSGLFLGFWMLSQRISRIARRKTRGRSFLTKEDRLTPGGSKGGKATL